MFNALKVLAVAVAVSGCSLGVRAGAAQPRLDILSFDDVQILPEAEVAVLAFDDVEILSFDDELASVETLFDAEDAMSLPQSSPLICAADTDAACLLAVVAR